MQRADAFDDDRRLAGAGDFCAHLVQTIGEIGDLGFARRVFDHGFAARQNSRHQRRMRAANRHFGKIDLAANQAVFG